MEVFTSAARDRDADELKALTDLLAAASTLRDIGPDLRDAIVEVTRRVDALTRADEERHQELAALGAKLNALLDRPEPAAVDIADHLARQDDRLAELHELVDRLHTVTVTARQPSAPVDTEGLRADLTLGLDVLAGVAQRLDRLDGRVEELLARPVEPPAADLAPLVVAVRELRGELAERLDAQQGALAERLDAHSSAVADRTEAGLAAMLRLIDTRLDRLRPADDDGAPMLAAFETLSASLAEIAGKQDELGTLIADLRTPASDDGTLEERLDAHVAGLARQLDGILGQLHATLAEHERRQPLVTTESLRRAAASVREVVGNRRR